MENTSKTKKGPSPKKKDLLIKIFSNQEAWEKWLAKNYKKDEGLWIRFFKKASGKKTIIYPEALEVALCYGWIDSQVKRYNEDSYIQKFTPRRKRSVWSKVNTLKVENLIKLKKMKPSGMAEVEAAKADGRWDQAYHSYSEIKVPEDFQKALDKNKKAKLFFESLNKSNRYYFLLQITTAKKPETRIRRIDKFVSMLSRGERAM